MYNPENTLEDFTQLYNEVVTIISVSTKSSLISMVYNTSVD